MSAVGLYVPPRSRRALLHRLPAGAKLLGLVLAVGAVVAAANAAVALAAAATAALLHPLCGVGVRPALRTLRALAPFLLAIALFQWLAGDWPSAARVCGQLLAAALLAGLVTASTRVSEMLDLFEKLARPLARFGADPRRVALVLALTVRCIPLVASAWHTSREAYIARGLRGRPDVMVVPVIVGLLRSADALGDALTARGID
ncbi:energy-coupling factor transporter transmembrane component T [Streptomonospora wellingtoniae]|uniref:Energy-coupling factor transporter transmembrane component T n=1 Tax=Streptomonospora wellingtoniae TaxID=3075544 RepID=A0ABU2KXQ7_9ACTN|nr:energy-coupling factor transporter transmembrane component T [Streptomonospora sp. DSM 45055]MDT0304081.1 energy-coupling factor transporter transmembrane component T [Streptomonospora sp. DSM 45055]